MDITKYEKLNTNENIQVGDIVQIDPTTRKITRAVNKRKHSMIIIGVCVKIENNTIFVANKGIVDVNVTGMIGIGSKLTSSMEPGKAKIIKHKEDETIFNIRSIGKVIGLYKDYNKAKVLLDIE